MKKVAQYVMACTLGLMLVGESGAWAARSAPKARAGVSKRHTARKGTRKKLNNGVAKAAPNQTQKSRSQTL